MRASHGTTKYCMAFLRGVSCSDHACMNLHEWGDEKDCFTKEDLTTLYVWFFSTRILSDLFIRKHTMKTTESRSRNAAGKKPDETDGTISRSPKYGIVYVIVFKGFLERHLGQIKALLCLKQQVTRRVHQLVKALDVEQVGRMRASVHLLQPLGQPLRVIPVPQLHEIADQRRVQRHLLRPRLHALRRRAISPFLRDPSHQAM